MKLLTTIKQNGCEPELASPLVLWIVRLALVRYPFLKPEIGDIVVEHTHVLGLCKHRLGLLSAIGELVKIEETKERGKVFTIKTLQGKEIRWENAALLVVEKANG